MNASQGPATPTHKRRKPAGSGMAMPASPLPDTVVKLLPASTRCCIANTPSAKAVSSKASAAAMPGSSAAPTMAKKISVDSTACEPPRMIGLPKSAMLSMKPTRKALAKPGLSSGSVTVAKVCQREARSVCAASSIDGLTPCTTPRKIMKAIGVKANICASHTPKKP